MLLTTFPRTLFTHHVSSNILDFNSLPSSDQNSYTFIYISSSASVGKLPVSAVSEEKLEVLRKYEQEKTDKLLSKYIAFCGKVLFICLFAVVVAEISFTLLPSV